MPRTDTDIKCETCGKWIERMTEYVVEGIFHYHPEHAPQKKTLDIKTEPKTVEFDQGE